MTTTKPSFLGLLNAIAIGESSAEPLFSAWASTTQDEELAKTLRFVGMREGEHGKAFAKRMLELGYEVRWPDPAGPEPKRLEVACSPDHSDVAKFEALGLGMGYGETDIFDSMFNDKNIDPVTGGLLGRYIAEERDSLRMLAADYQRLKSVEPAGPMKTSKAGAPKKAVKKTTKKKAKSAAGRSAASAKK